MLGIVVVTYKSYDDTVAFVKQVLPKIGIPYRAVIVDLGNDDDTAADLAAVCGATLVTEDAPSSRLIPSALYLLHVKENLGYARGNNRGAEFLFEICPDLKWLLFSNNDVELVNPDAIDVLVRRLEKIPDAAAVGPRIMRLDGSEECQVLKPLPLVRAIAYNTFFPILNRFGNREQGCILPAGSTYDGACYWLRGCFFVVKADDFRQVGMFDPATFLYWEEAILAERFRRIGRCEYFVPEVSITHYAGKTTEKFLTASSFARYDQQSLRHYYRHYRGIGACRLFLFDVSGVVRLALIRLLEMLRGWRQSSARNGARGGAE